LRNCTQTLNRAAAAEAKKKALGAAAEVFGKPQVAIFKSQLDGQFL